MLYEDMVRLHVLADNDTPRAQAIKMHVVRAIRKDVSRAAARARDAKEAMRLIEQRKNRIRTLAKRELAKHFVFYPVRVETGVFAFPQKRYGDRLVPAGAYPALRVLLGAGAGKNWWCVLYPDLCAVEDGCAEALKQFGNVTFYSSVVRAIRMLFTGGCF